ncbi:MAG TPA: DUF6328 family protein [Acidimicrobiales bacterium]|nr:DUF6328 family protein [Acidimicrobiales bacterium]
MEENETKQQRVDRELGELLNELRVALPGVQVLFAFLLTVPFQQHFQHITSFLRNVYQATLLASALAVILLISPAAQHRLLFRRHDKEPMLFRFNRYAVAGLVCLGAALTGSVLLVTSYLFGDLHGEVTAAVTAAVFLGLWVARPLQRRRVTEPDPDPE